MASRYRYARHRSIQPKSSTSSLSRHQRCAPALCLPVLAISFRMFPTEIAAVSQVSRAGVRPPDIAKDTKGAMPARTQQAPPFGKGPRVYVGGVPDFVTGERVREHFSQWGFVTDVYFPSNKGQKRMNYCFVSFQAQQSAERACNESPRNLDGWVSSFWHLSGILCCQHLCRLCDIFSFFVQIFRLKRSACDGVGVHSQRPQLSNQFLEADCLLSYASHKILCH